MVELSHILRVLLKRLPYQNFLNGQMNCRDLRRDTIEHIVHTYMTEYSDTEVRNILDGISESSRNDCVSDYDNTISCTISAFELLFRFVEKILIWKNNEVRVRYENILRWRTTTQDLGEEFFVAAFIAMQDLRNGCYCKNFGWPFVIGHNNVQLKKITEKGMAENHFHLWGAAPYFQISWIWMMNHVGQVQNQTSLENMKENPRLLWWSSGKENAEGDLKKSCLQAALIRLYLYSLLTEKEIEIGKYYIEWTKLVPWAKKLKGSIPEEIVEKRRGWSLLDVLTTPFDGYEENFEHISVELKRYMFALENILREGERWDEFLPNTGTSYIKLSDILCAMFKAKKKIKLRDCYRLLDIEEYRKLWKDITYKKVVLYLNNYDIMRWHVDDIQRAISDISGSEKDYMLNYVRYSTVFDAKSNFYVEGERKFLYEMFRHIKKEGSSWNAQVYNFFYAYLIIKERLRGEMVQSNDWLGFENFSIYQRRSGAFANEVFWEKLKARAAVSSCFEQKVKKLEIRLSPYDSARRNFQEICFLDEAIQADINKYYYVFHFIKKRDLEKIDEKHCVYRHEKLRREIFKKTEAILGFRNNYPEVAERVRGIDAAANEIGCRPEVFAQSFRTLQENTEYKFTDRGHRSLPQLRATYHVGEDFLDVVDGMRAIDEAVLFLNLDCGDRLGHALALGIDVEKWYKLKRYSISLPKQDYLDNIVWLYHMLERYQIAGFDNLKTWIELEYHKCFERVYGQFMDNAYIQAIQKKKNKTNYKGVLNFNIHAYFDAWKLRGDAPELYRDGFYSVNSQFQTSYELHAVNEKFPTDGKERFNTEAAILYHFYHYNANVRVEGKKNVMIKINEEYIKAAKLVQKGMQREIARRGLAIETNPSSNVMIGPFSRYDEHPITKFYNNGLTFDNEKLNESPQVWVSINTDDPGVFNIKLENEYALLASALEKMLDENGNPVYSKTMIYDWLDKIREMGLEQSFIGNEETEERNTRNEES